MTTLPMPLEWHPYYRDQTWLLDWLEGQEHTILIQRPGSEPIVMTRRCGQAPAPYVGDPFWYEWPIGVDNLHRCIAGEAQRVYEDPIE